MRQSVPWSVKGVGSEAREAAKDLARRSGMTLGQWLNAMISEQTGDGREETIEDEDTSPLAALAARLDEASRRPASPASPARPAARDTWQEERSEATLAMERLRATEARTAGLLEALVRRHGETEARTAQLIENLARVNRATEGKTAQALASITRWIETAERAPKDNGRTADRDAIEAIRAIAGRLDQIEGRLPQPDAVPRPVKAAIDRLEARLTSLADRSEPTQNAADEMMRTAAELERRLAALAEKVSTPPPPAPAQPEPAAENAARIEARLARMLDTLQPQPPAGRASLERAIAQINSRQAALDQGSPAVPVWPPRPSAAAGRSGSAEAEPVRSGGLDGVRDQIAGLTQEIAQLRAAGRSMPDFANDPTLAELRREITNISASLPSLAATQGLRALEGRIEGLVDRVEDLRFAGAATPQFKALERQLADIVRQMSELQLPDLNGVTQSLKSISGKLDLVAAQGVDPSALVRLQKQAEDIRSLIGQTARPDDIDALAGRMDDLATRLDRMQATLSRPSVETPSPVLAELATRLDRLQDMLARPQGGVPKKAIDDLTAKLERVEDVLSRPQAAMPAVALDDLATRLDRLQEMLRQPPASVGELDAIASRLDRLQDSLEETRPPMPAPAFEELNDRLEQLQRSLDKPQAGLPGAAIEALAERLDRMNETLAAPRALTAHPAIDALVKRLDGVQDALLSPQPLVATGSLESMISLLAERLEKAQQPGADDGALEALEREVKRIAERLEGQGGRSSDLSGIERTLGELMANLEQTRNAAIDAADDAALRAVRETMAQLPTRGGEKLPEDMRRHLEDLRESQDRTGRSTQVTLEAVNATLERLADRLTMLEGHASGRPAASTPAEALKARAGSAMPAPAAARAEVDVAVKAPSAAPREVAETDMVMDLPLEPGSGGPGGPNARSALDASPVRASPAAPAGNDPRSVFIAAARRAAQAAAAEAAVPAPVPAKPAAARPEPEPTAPARQSRDHAAALKAEPRVAAASGASLFQRNRRPILLGMAAATLALGAIASYNTFGNEMVSGVASTTPVASPDAPAAAKPETPAPVPPATVAPAPSSSVVIKPQASLLSPVPETTASITPPAATTRSIGMPILPSGIPSLTDAMAQSTAQANQDAAAVAARPALPAKLEAALQAGDPRASFDTASRLITANSPPADLKAAAQLYQSAAAKGFAPAQYRLGSMYEKGIGVDKDIAMAKSWYERAAAKGNIKAMHNMAVLYAEGAIDGKPDYGMAGQWFRQAAEHGLRDSQFNLAILVARGLGTAADAAEGYKWLSLAAEQGDADAAKKRDEIGKRLDSTTRQKMDLAVASFKPKEEPLMANETTLPAMAWTDEQAKGV